MRRVVSRLLDGDESLFSVFYDPYPEGLDHEEPDSCVAYILATSSLDFGIMQKQRILHHIVAISYIGCNGSTYLKDSSWSKTELWTSVSNFYNRYSASDHTHPSLLEMVWQDHGEINHGRKYHTTYGVPDAPPPHNHGAPPLTRDQQDARVDLEIEMLQDRFHSFCRHLSSNVPDNVVMSGVVTYDNHSFLVLRNQWMAPVLEETAAPLTPGEDLQRQEEYRFVVIPGAHICFHYGLIYFQHMPIKCVITGTS
jgi:hypothetical protein